MTDYCFNEIVFYCQCSKIDELTVFFGEENGGFSFNKICPEPEQKDINWDCYKWRTENWSTKWECENVLRKKTSVNGWNFLYVKFDCPWHLPLKIITKLNEMFPCVYMTFSWTLENQWYQTKIGVRHIDKGWNNIYHDELKLEDDVYENHTGPIDLKSKYDGYIYNEVYSEMSKLEGFKISLGMINFRDNWFENSKII